MPSPPAISIVRQNQKPTSIGSNNSSVLQFGNGKPDVVAVPIVPATFSVLSKQRTCNIDASPLHVQTLYQMQVNQMKFDINNNKRSVVSDCKTNKKTFKKQHQIQSYKLRKYECIRYTNHTIKVEVSAKMNLESIFGHRQIKLLQVWVCFDWFSPFSL